MSEISTQRLEKLFLKGDTNEQIKALDWAKEFVKNNLEIERKKHETEMQKLQLRINEIVGNT